MVSELQYYKKEVAYFMRRLYKKNLTTSSGGNISYKFDNDTVLISPSELDKARIKGNQTCIATIMQMEKCSLLFQETQ